MRLLPALALATVVLLAACTADEGGAPSVEPTATVTAPPAASPTAPATPAVRPTPAPVRAFIVAHGEPVPTLEVSPEARFTSRAVAPGEELDVEHGAVIADPVSGAGELWQLAVDDIDERDWVPYAWSGDGRFLLSLQVLAQRYYLLDRETGTSFEWDFGRLHVVAGPDSEGLVLFRARETDCRFFLARLGAGGHEAIVAFGDPVGGSSCSMADAVFSQDGSRLLVVDHAAGSRDGRGYLVSTADGMVEPLDEGLELMMTPYATADGFVLVGASGAKDAPPAVQVASYALDGSALGTVTIPAGEQGREVYYFLLSPDGRYLAWQQDLPLGVPEGLGGREQWPTVVVADVARGEVLFRAVRASLSNGAVLLRWLADSSGVVIGTLDGFAVLAVDGRLEPLPFGPVDHFAPVPLPSPVEASRYLYDGRLVDGSGRELGTPAAAAVAWGPNWWTRGWYDWTEDGGAIAFRRSPPAGRDYGPGGLSDLGLPVRVERPPFSAEVRIRVQRKAELHESPSDRSPVTGEIAAGTRATVVDKPGDGRLCNAAPSCSVAYDERQPDVLWWLHVRAEDGTEGWLPAEGLAWDE